MKFFISAGDHSADRYAGKLVEVLKKSGSDIEVISYGGRHLKEVSDVFLFDLAGMAISGFLSPLLKFPLIKRLLDNAQIIFSREPISAVILLDYYGFNIFLAEYASKLGIPVIYFISPQIWASRYSRIKKLKKYVTKMFVIFPFEEGIYTREGVAVEFVGHPMSEYAASFEGRKPVTDGKISVGVLPGSRLTEIKNHIKTLLDSVQKVRAKFSGAVFYFFISANITGEQLASFGVIEGEFIKIVRENNFELRRTMDISWCCSGTACMENAFFGIPTICFYRMNPLNYLIAKAIVKVKYIAMPNIIADRELMPELIQSGFNAESLAKHTLEYIELPSKLMDNSKKLRAVASKMVVKDFYGTLGDKIVKAVKEHLI